MSTSGLRCAPLDGVPRGLENSPVVTSTDPGQALLVERRSASPWPGDLEKVPTLKAPIPHLYNTVTVMAQTPGLWREACKDTVATLALAVVTASAPPLPEGEPGSWRG